MLSSSTTIDDLPTSTASIPTPSCTTAVPDKNGWVPLDACNSQYAYNPNFAAECAFAALFGLSMPFCWVLLVGASWEFLAFLMKALGAKDQQNVGYVVPAQLLFLLAPLWINAFAYMTVARLVYFSLLDQRVCRIKAAWLTKTFVWIDVLCFLTQATGGGMMSVTDLADDNPIITIGKRLYMGGCGAQLGFVILFCVIIVRLHIKAKRELRGDMNMRRPIVLAWVMFAVLMMIITRVIFRLVEFSPASSDDHLSTSEKWALAFDAMPMFLALFLLNVVHPGWILRGPNSEFPRAIKRSERSNTQEGKTNRDV
ncbi:hypothetical protein ACO1O0_003596 [Amphichorda felina]